ncbi:hypothetical protein [Geodermatophilus sp. SYSU D00684]
MGMELTAPAPDGWIAVYGEGGGPTYYVRCRDDGRGGVEIVRLLIASQGRITSAALRNVPIGRIEATINGSPLLLAAARSAEDAPDPLVERLETQPVPDFRDALSGNSDQRLPSVNEPLARPDRSDPAAFYSRVAMRYLLLVRDTAKPAVAMAEEAGVPVATARRWINEARRRGLLAPGRQGRAK